MLNKIFIYLEIYYFILAPCVSRGIFNGFSFWLGVNVNHQEVARVDSACVRVCVCVWGGGVKHRCSLAAICKVNVVENSIHLSTHPSQNSFISPSALTPLLIVLSNVTCMILSVSDAINKVFKSVLLPSYPSWCSQRAHLKTEVQIGIVLCAAWLSPIHPWLANK